MNNASRSLNTISSPCFPLTTYKPQLNFTMSPFKKPPDFPKPPRPSSRSSNPFSAKQIAKQKTPNTWSWQEHDKLIQSCDARATELQQVIIDSVVLLVPQTQADTKGEYKVIITTKYDELGELQAWLVKVQRFCERIRRTRAFGNKGSSFDNEVAEVSAYGWIVNDGDVTGSTHVSPMRAMWQLERRMKGWEETLKKA